MKNFFKNNIMSIIATGLVSLLTFICYNTIRNTTRIDSLVHDIGEIKDSFRTIVKMMLEESNEK